MSEDKANEDLYRRVKEHLQELIEPDLPEAKLSPAERLELLEQARASEPCRDLLESYEKTVSLLSSRPDVPVPEDFSRQVGESIDDSTPVIPFVRTEKFQRLLGVAAAVVLMTLVVWRSVTPPEEDPFSGLVFNEPTGEPTLEFAADEPPAKPRAGTFSLEKSIAPETQELGSVAEAEEETEGDEPVVPAPGAVEIADAAAVSDPAPAAPPAGAVEVAAANQAQQKKPGSPIEVSRESIDGQLVAVRYEVEVPRSRLAELKAWQARRGLARPALAAARAESKEALQPKSRARQASSLARRPKDKLPGQEKGEASGEFLALVVDAGKLESLHQELAALQTLSPVRDRASRRGIKLLEAGSAGGVAKRSAKALRKAAPAPAGLKKDARSESSAGLKEDSPAGSALQAKKANRQPGAAGKAAAAAGPQVRVEIRFRIVPD